MSAPYDLIIVGGGLAGWALAQALPEGLFERVALVDAPHPMRASGAPGALLHALPGRSLDPDPLTMRAFAHASAWAEDLLGQDPALVRRHTMLRPLWPGKPGRRFVNTYTRGHPKYPACMDHAHLDAAALAALHPTLALFEGAIAYGPAYMIRLPQVLEHIAGRSPHIQRMRGHVRALHPGDEHWEVDTSDARLRAHRVALCAGAGLGRWFPNLGVEVNAGELLVCPAPPGGFDGAISGGGHIAQDSLNQWVLGATYLRPTGPPELDASWTRPDHIAHEELTQLLGRLVPAVAHARGTIWRGQRAVRHPSRSPVCGGIPDQPGLFVMGALGSKGLLWSSWLAAQLAAHMAGSPTPHLDSSPLHPHHSDFGPDSWLLEHTPS